MVKLNKTSHFDTLKHYFNQLYYLCLKTKLIVLKPVIYSEIR